jgi:hypothetical protein
MSAQTSQTSRRDETSTGGSVQIDDDVLFQAGEFVDAQLLLGGEGADGAAPVQAQAQQVQSQPAVAASAASEPARSMQPPADRSSLAQIDSALASNLDTLLQSDYESVEQVLIATAGGAPNDAQAATAQGSISASHHAAPSHVIHKGGTAAGGASQGGGIIIQGGQAPSGSDGQVFEASFDAAETVAAGLDPRLSPERQDAAAATQDGSGVVNPALTREALMQPVAPANVPHAAEQAQSRPAQGESASPAENSSSTDSATDNAGSAGGVSSRRSLRERAAAAAHPALHALHMVNRPLAMLPAKFHRMIDVISLSTLFWAAVVWGVVIFSPPHHASAGAGAHAGASSGDSSAAPSAAHTAVEPESTDGHH